MCDGSYMSNTKPTKNSGFSCQECRYVFRTLAAAERAAFGAAGCPKCGGTDILRGA